MVHKLKIPLFLIACGLLVVGALAPFHWVVLAFVGLSGLFLALETAQRRWQAFLYGLWFGVGFYGGGLYWLSNAFLVNGDKHAWLIPIAIPLLAVGMGLFAGLTCLLAHLLYRNKRDGLAKLGRVILFAVSWVVIEWLRSWLFTGFPWNMLGSVWGGSDAFLQPAAYVSTFGLSLLTAFVCCLPALLWKSNKKMRMQGAALLCVSLVLWATFGQYRLSATPEGVVDGVVLRLVQPAIPQAEKWLPEYQVRNLNRHLEMSVAPPKGPNPATHIIWGETATTYPLNRQADVRHAIAGILDKQQLLITGNTLMTPRGEKPFQVWNSLAALDSSAEIIARYDKSHLVPFGEYVPFRDVLPLQKLTQGLVDFSAGPGLETLKLSGLPPFSPLICYEVIFPHRVVAQEAQEGRAEWLLNLTNDGWYNDSPGPYQHALSARLRSIEEGLPMVRVANGGISFVTDSYGRIQAQLPYGISDYLDIALPKALLRKTWTARLGPLPWIILLGGFFIIGQRLSRNKGPKSSTNDYVQN